MRPLIAILALFLALYVVPLALRPPAAPDEYRYGEVPREMIAGGDWVVPRLNGMPYFEKPVLGYWLIGACILVLGESIFALRLPSALSAGATALALYLLLRRFGRDRREAPMVAAAWLTTLLPFALGVTAVLDGLFSFFVTSTMVGTFFAVNEERPRRRRWLLAGAGFAAGCAFLIKGALGWVLPALSLAPWLLLRGGPRRLLRLAWLPAAVSVLVVAPWAVAVHLRSEFWERFIWVEHLQRFSGAGQDQHPAAFWYYAVFLIPAALPWIVLLPAAAGSLWRRRREPGGDLVLFAACWFAAPLVLFSAASGKLITYILPCVPPLLILIVRGSSSRIEEAGHRALRWASGLSASAGGLLALAVVLGRYRGERILEALEKDHVGLAAVAVALVAWMAFSLAGMLSRNGWATLRWLAAAPILLLLAAHGLGRGQVFHTSPDALIRRNLQRVGPDVVLVGDNKLAQALCWITGRDDVQIFGGGGEMEYGLERTPGRAALDPEGLRLLIERSSSPVVLAMRWNHWKHYRQRYPQKVRQERGHRFVFLEFAPGLPDSSP